MGDGDDDDDDDDDDKQDRPCHDTKKMVNPN
jgi:hypothetical protein